jgi:hypothetical protein
VCHQQNRPSEAASLFALREKAPNGAGAAGLAAEAAGSGFLPNKPPLKRPPGLALLLVNAVAFSAGFGAAPNGPPEAVGTDRKIKKNE